MKKTPQRIQDVVKKNKNLKTLGVVPLIQFFYEALELKVTTRKITKTLSLTSDYRIAFTLTPRLGLGTNNSKNSALN